MKVPLVTITPDQRAKVLEAIRTRTIEEGDCLMWTGANSRGANTPRPQPAIWLDGETKALRRMAYVAYGSELFAHWRVVTTCRNDACLNEKHLKRATRSDAQSGNHRGLLTRAKLAAAHQARSPLDWEKVREIRASDLSNRKLGEVYGVNRDTIHKERRYLTWRETGMFSGLVAPR